MHIKLVQQIVFGFSLMALPGLAHAGQVIPTDSTNSTANGSQSIAGGNNAYAHGTRSFAMGNFAVVDTSYQYGFAFGYGIFTPPSTFNPTDARNYAFSFGYTTHAWGDHSFAFGRNNYAHAAYSLAFGQNVNAVSNYSFAFGYNVSAEAANAFAFGDNTEASGTSSIAMGTDAEASGNYAISLGYSNLASGYGSFATGVQNDATGMYSSAFGYSNSAAASFSSALGIGLVTSGYGSTVVGVYNSTPSGQDATTRIAGNALFIVGNGSSTSSRSNAFVVYGNGNATLAGTLTTSSTLTASNGFALSTGDMNINSGASTFSKIVGSNAPTQKYFSLEDGAGFGMWSAYSGLKFKVNDVEKLRIDSNGNLGIGATSPSTKLEVVGDTGVKIVRASNTDQTLTLMGGDGSGRADVKAAYQLNLNSNNSSYPMTFQIGGTEKMRISNSGNLGVGDTAPSAKLSIKGAGTGTGMALNVTDSGSASKFKVLDNGDVIIAKAQGDISMGEFQ